MRMKINKARWTFRERRLRHNSVAPAGHTEGTDLEGGHKDVKRRGGMCNKYIKKK
jgi:hypothetical protein